MKIPTKKDLKKIQRNVKTTNGIKASVCGGAACNCTCGGRCNAPILHNYLNLDNRFFEM